LTAPDGARSTPESATTPSLRAPVKPIASKTRSAFRSNSVPGIGRMIIRPSTSGTASERAQRTPVTRPFSPTNSVVTTEKSRSAPSSWLDEVRSFSGQFGQVSALFSRSGGCGMISNWVTESAP
jgi:hypothetical protein